MKRIFSILISVALFFSSVLFVGAAGSVSFALGSVEAENGRLIDVDVYADSASAFSSGVFDFSFDKTALNFRECEADEKTAIKYNPTDGGVRVVYLCLENSSLSNKSIFKLRFKTLKEGDTEVGISACDCFDADAAPLGVTGCGSARIGVKGTDTDSASSAGDDSRKNDVKNAREKGVKETKAAKEAKSDEESLDPEDASDDGIKSLGSVNDVAGNDGVNWILYAAIGIGAVILILTGVKIVTSFVRKKSKTRGDINENE